MSFDVFEKTAEFARRNHFVDIEDKIPIFLCSVGGHIFNCLNKCSRCDFDPDSPIVDEDEDFVIENCPLRHDNLHAHVATSRHTHTHTYARREGFR